MGLSTCPYSVTACVSQLCPFRSYRQNDIIMVTQAYSVHEFETTYVITKVREKRELKN